MEVIFSRLLVGCGVVWVGFALGCSVFAALDPYDRTKDIRPATLQEIKNGRHDWGLDLSAGLGVARGNANLDSINVDLDSFKRFGDYAGYILGDLYYTDFNGTRVRNQGNTLARIDYSFNDKWKVFSVSGHSYNQYIKLGYRGTLSAGLLYKLDFGPILSGISVAPGYEFETYLDDEVRRTLRLSCRYLAHILVSDTASIGLDYFYLPSVLDLANYRMYLSLSLENQIYKKLIGLRLSSSMEYFSAPIVGVVKFDVNLSTSFFIHLGE